MKNAEDKTAPVRLTPKMKNFLTLFTSVAACNVSETCKRMEINRQTYYNWYNNNEKFKEAIDEANEAMLDMAETKLHKNITEGKEASIFFFLKTKGKKRGYIETVEQQHTGDGFMELMKAASKAHADNNQQ